MKRVPRVLVLIGGCWLAVGSAPSAYAAGTRCVGGPGCYPTLQAAVNAAHDGDTITIAPGTYAGGVTIDVSVRVVGSGADRTTIRGGGPVLTLGAFGASSEPTISISNVKITGGVTRSSPESVPFTGKAGVFAVGGGVEIPPNADFSGGVTVSITNSVITGNRAAPRTAVDSGFPCPLDITIACINGDLPFAQAAGGGIDNWGTLTLDDTTISNNRVGAAAGLSPNLASDAYAGAIENWLNPLTISNSTISGNQASASAPNGRFADSGAIFVEGGALTMNGSTVSNNTASLAASMPNDVPTGFLAVAGGIHISNQATGGSIENTTVAGNAVTMTNTVGDANAFSGAVHIDTDNLTLSNDVITNNNVTVATLGHSSGNAAADSGAGEMGGTITNTRLVGNSVSARSVAEDAIASAGAMIFAGSITNSNVNDNHVQASSPNGTAIDGGGGLVAGDNALTLRNTTVSGNTINTSGRSGFAQGGGIFDVNLSPNGPPGGPLNLINSSVTGNVLSANTAIALQGGGIYATNPVSLTNSVIAENIPDQCLGC